MALDRKLRKLVKDPRNFLADSFAYRELRALMHTLPWHDTMPARPGNFGQRLGPLTDDQIQSYIAGQAPVFSCRTKHGILALCTIESRRHDVVRALVALCAVESFRFTYWKNRRFHEVTSLRSMYSILLSSRRLSFRLEDLCTDVVHDLELQTWTETSESIDAPTGNPISRRVWRRVVEEHALLQLGSNNRLESILQKPPTSRVQFDVDFVYTWVNNQDPEWQALYQGFRPAAATDSSGLSRFYNRDELKYSLRALSEFAPWVRKVHVVTNCRPPSWVDTEKVNWVSHEEIFDSETLPTFSSHAIESRLHHIPGLSNHFVYSNDDFLLIRDTTKRDFFEPNGLCRLKLEDWGNVNGEARSGEPDYLNAARNSQRLIERDFGVSPVHLHAHAPQAMRVDILREMEMRYQEDFSRTARARFRAATDIAVTGFLFHHYAYVTGRAMEDSTPTMLVQPNHHFHDMLQGVLDQRKSLASARCLSVCINDGNDSHLNRRWNVATQRFLNSYFPRCSSFERR